MIHPHNQDETQSNCIGTPPQFRFQPKGFRGNQVALIAEMFAIDAKTKRRMSFRQFTKSTRRFIAKIPVQTCPSCSAGNSEPEPILRSYFQGWRVTYLCCGDHLQDIANCAIGSCFRQYATVNHRGEKLLNDDAERGICSWASPLELACLLLMHRISWPPPSDGNLWRFRVRGAIIPELEEMLAKQTSFTSSLKKPILPLHIRPALLAGVAIVERAGLRC